MTDLSTPTLTALDEDRTPGRWDRVLPFGSVGIGNMSFPAPIDQTKRPGESWLQMRQRIHPELKQRDAEQEANARLCALAPDLLAEVLRLRGDRDALLEAAIALANAETDYRLKHDLHGGGDIKTGRAWDHMRRCAQNVRNAALKSQEE